MWFLRLITAVLWFQKIQTLTFSKRFQTSEITAYKTIGSFMKPVALFEITGTGGSFIPIFFLSNTQN
jgi:hypothetical protein